MKTYLLSFLFLLLPSFLVARSYDTLNYKFNYSKMKIDGDPAKRYVYKHIYRDEKNADDAFDKFKEEVEYVFLKSANKNALENHGYTLDNEEESRYLIVIYILDVDEDGEHKIEANIVDKNNEENVLETVSAKAGSGKFNSFFNLFLEQLEKSAERLGDKIADEMDDLK